MSQVSKLVRSGIVVDAAEGLVDVAGQRVGSSDDVVSSLDLDGAVAAGGADEFPDGPAAAVLDPAADGQGGEHDGQVGFDRVALVVVDRPLTPADSLPLPDSPQAVPDTVLQYAEALDIISQRSNMLITLPDVSTLTADEYATAVGTANILRGETVYGRWVPIPARPKPDEIDPRLVTAAGPVASEQPLAVSMAGIEYDLGKAYSYLPSARTEGDITAEPRPDGTIDVTLIPGENNHAVRSRRQRSRAEVQAVIDLHSSTGAEPTLP